MSVVYASVLSRPKTAHLQRFVMPTQMDMELTSLDAEVPELDADVGTGTEGDVEARCFSECHGDAPLVLKLFPERDSPRDQLIVTFFLLIVLGLLLFAAIRARLQKAIETRGRPTDLREWGEVSGFFFLASTSV
ncbi:hypothetical protein P7C73_g3183, partial [Tremellales sp. Uapishka_1]